ncbi:MAG: hypothetical protein ACTHLE_23680 [Agriterribacter sp.]
MKSLIQNTNKTLLEKFPLVWNTRLVWMLLVALLAHLIFFALGLNAFNNPKLLQEYYADQLFIHNGMLLFSVICSVLIIVVWLIILFRNNSFKNFYPTSRWQLFVSFLIYFLVFFLNTSFYVSYILGYKTDVTDKYPDSKLQSEIETTNLAAAFLSFNPRDYTIDRRKYPSPFDTLYCETNEEQVDFTKPYLQRFNDEYQFYTVIRKFVSSASEKELGKSYLNSIYQESTSDSVTMFAYRGQVIDMSALATTEPSYYNYSDVFINQYGTFSSIFSRSYSEVDYGRGRDSAGIAMNKAVYDFLKRNDSREFKKLLTDFLAIAKELRIATNLTADNWLQLINRRNFNVEKFIENSKMPPDGNYYNNEEEMVDAIGGEADSDTVRNTPENRSKQQQFYHDRQTKYHFDAEGLRTVFGNIISIKRYDHWNFIFHFQAWLAFGLAVLLFAFRTSGLPALLFSIITGSLIAILLVLITIGLNVGDELVISYTIFTVGTIILLMPLLVLNRIKKSIQAVFINLTLAGIVPYILLFLIIVNTHQERYYQKILGDLYYKKRPDLILDILGEHLSWLLLVAGFTFILLYTAIIRKWRALPEG